MENRFGANGCPVIGRNILRLSAGFHQIVSSSTCLAMQAPKKSLLSFQQVSVIRNGIKLLDEIHWEVEAGQHWAITGVSGSGKTLLSEVIIGNVAHQGQVRLMPGLIVERVNQQHHFLNRSHTRDLYYQQRFQSQDAEDALTLSEVIEEFPASVRLRKELLLKQLQLEACLPKSMIQLSNGENKRFQLLKALLYQPDLIVLDNPFVGLDATGRHILNHLLDEIAHQGIQLVVIGPANEWPSRITHVLELQQGKAVFSGPLQQYKQFTFNSNYTLPENLLAGIDGRLNEHFSHAVQMNKVTIQYGEQVVLKALDWEVPRGSRWLISGPNGAGKSTLLSLINGDHPQAYANEIYLFDQRKGQGESIWDLKRKIGFISPELHLYFDRSLPVHQVVASGLFDTIGLFRQLSDDQHQQVQNWLHILSLQHLSMRSFDQLSLGQQRMVLLARALVKNPPLLILDEPCQGLDASQTLFFNTVVDQYCLQNDTTLLYVSHYRDQIPRCIHSFLELDAGKRIR